MFVCICNAITDHQIKETVSAGASTLSDLQAQLGVAKPPRTQTSTQRQQTEHNETTTAPARVADDTPCRAMLPSYRIKGLTPFEYNLHRTRAQTRKRT